MVNEQKTKENSGSELTEKIQRRTHGRSTLKYKFNVK
jgi:hypothetical protein